MKIYKLKYQYDNDKPYFLRLAFMPNGKFLGLNRLDDGTIEAVYDMRIEQGYECFNYKGELRLKLNEAFSYPDEYMEEDGPTEFSAVTKGNISITLVEVEVEEEDVFTLYNGVEVPRLGYGTWLIQEEEARTAVKNAIERGYIHIDSAQAYRNEVGVGEAIRNSILDRKDVFITSKVQAEIKSYKEAKESIENSLKNLGVDYIDLMLIHCPTPWQEYSLTGGYRYEKENLEVWKALEEAYEEKKIRSIGVSNFNIDDIKNIMNNAKIKPMVNQIPIHLGNVDKELIKFCRDNQIMVESYSPLGHGRLFKEELVNKIMDKVYSKNRFRLSYAQLLLSYASSYSDIILPKASSTPHMLDNLKYLISLDEDMIKDIEEVFNSLNQ